MIPTSEYVKEHPRSWCWSSSLPQFKQASCTGISPSSPSLTKRIWQRRHSEVLGQTHQPHVPSNSPSVSDCMEFVAGVHWLFKHHNGWLCKDLASDKSQRASFASDTCQAFPKLHWKMFTPRESRILGISEIVMSRLFTHWLPWEHLLQLTWTFCWPLPVTSQQKHWSFHFFAGLLVVLEILFDSEYTWLYLSVHFGCF